jgi:excisionase family DNA binding protein
MALDALGVVRHRNPHQGSHQLLASADYLTVTQDTVRRWCRTGVLRCIALGDRAGYRIRQEDLDKFLEARSGND